MKANLCDFLVFDNVTRLEKIRLAIVMPYRVVWALWTFTDFYVLSVIRLVNNWWDVGFVFFGIKRNANIKLKDGSQTLLRKEDINGLVSKMRSLTIPEETMRRFGVKVNGDRAVMKVDGKRIVVGEESVTAMVMEFDTIPHKQLNVKGRDVLDVGAYLGETSFYYALKGKARRVYAFEPVPYLYRKTNANVKMSNLQKKITVIEAAVGGKRGKLKVGDSESSFAARDLASQHAKEVSVDIIPLDEIVRKYRIKHGVLKIDTEGAEYETFRLASDEALLAFDKMHIEYHYGYADIADRLRKLGFKVRLFNHPFYNFKGFSQKAMLNGDMIAER